MDSGLNGSILRQIREGQLLAVAVDVASQDHCDVEVGVCGSFTARPATEHDEPLEAVAIAAAPFLRSPGREGIAS